MEYLEAETSASVEESETTHLYDGSCSMSDLGSPLGLTSPNLSARLSRAS